MRRDHRRHDRAIDRRRTTSSTVDLSAARPSTALLGLRSRHGLRLGGVRQLDRRRFDARLFGDRLRPALRRARPRPRHDRSCAAPSPARLALRPASAARSSCRPAMRAPAGAAASIAAAGIAAAQRATRRAAATSVGAVPLTMITSPSAASVSSSVASTRPPPLSKCALRNVDPIERQPIACRLETRCRDLDQLDDIRRVDLHLRGRLMNAAAKHDARSRHVGVEVDLDLRRRGMHRRRGRCGRSLCDRRGRGLGRRLVATRASRR